MKNHKGTMVCVMAVCLGAATLVGRAASPDRDEAAQSAGQAQGPPPPGPGPDRPGHMGLTFGGFGGPMMAGRMEVVTGAPYSAQATTEITQTLADGNRIVRKVTASVYRDSAGRVRRDQVLAAVGSWMPEDQPKTTIIDDPVAHLHYILNPDRQTAARYPMDSNGFKGRRGDKSADSATSGSGQPDPNAPGGPRRRGPGTVETTPLGTQTIEGVQATGTQSVLTIEAGAIGNDQAIRIMSEEWYSEDLKTVVLRKRSDPRFGEMVYQLTQISRTEPDPTLFQVPANYTITDGGRTGPRFGGPLRPRRPN